MKVSGLNICRAFFLLLLPHFFSFALPLPFPPFFSFLFFLPCFPLSPLLYISSSFFLPSQHRYIMELKMYVCLPILIPYFLEKPHHTWWAFIWDCSSCPGTLWFLKWAPRYLAPSLIFLKNCSFCGLGVGGGGGMPSRLGRGRRLGLAPQNIKQTEQVSNKSMPKADQKNNKEKKKPVEQGFHQLFYIN